MYGFASDAFPTAKCYAIHGVLPPFINLKQPPTNKAPFSTIRAQKLSHTAELILEEHTWDVVSAHIDCRREFEFSKVILSLSDLLERPFFTDYVKSRNIVMVSEGRVGIDRTYCLSDGVLRLLLDKESYERAGLVGTAHGSAKTRRSKARWMVEIDLKSGSMLHGKKGFERIVWAFKNVLVHSVTWLFHDPTPPADTSLTNKPHPLEKHHPIIKTCKPQIQRTPQTLVPPLHPPLSSNELDDHLQDALFDDYISELHEWLSLVSLNSPQVLQSSTIDPFLSRYEIPNAAHARPQTLVRVRWEGLIPSVWVTETWTQTLKALRDVAPLAWCALSVNGFDSTTPKAGQSYTILRLPPQLTSAPPTTTAYSTTATCMVQDIIAVHPENHHPSPGEAKLHPDTFVVMAFEDAG